MKNKKLRLKIIEFFDNQTHFAKAVGVQPSVVSEVVNGKRILNEEQKQSWALALGGGSVEKLF